MAIVIHKRTSYKPVWTERLFEQLFLRSWWVWLFLFFCLCVYLPTINKRNREVAHLQTRYHSLEAEKYAALDKREELFLRLQSQSDPAWIEQVLIRELGVVPDGYLKVHFKKK